MAVTTMDQVMDLFLALIDDYRLTSILNTSGSMVLSTFMEPWLIMSMVEFSNICNQPLNYTATSASAIGQFDQTLTQENMVILAQMCVKYWLKKSIQNILQMANNIQDADFKSYSQAQNLQAKQQYYIVVQEEIARLLTEYAYKNNDWSNWQNQTFP
jgi:hypothetical protein